MSLRGVWCSLGPQERRRGSIQIIDGRVSGILNDADSASDSTTKSAVVDLSGFLVMPGLVNAHDHLQFGLFPRLGDPPYSNYIDWGVDIHDKFRDVIAKHRRVPKDARLWWGGIKNLLCGVTTVCHHDSLWPELSREDYPIRVVQRYGWGHSVALGVDLLKAHSDTHEGDPFIVHACEGVDELASSELAALERMGLLDERTVLVHGLALDAAGVRLMQRRGASLIVCPSSNQFLFSRIPDVTLFGMIENVALGNDSPLTATGDLLDEIRFAQGSCGIRLEALYDMVTEAPAAVLRLVDQEGSIRKGGVADLVAVQDDGREGAARLASLSMHEVELVMVGGCVQLASEMMMKRFPKAACRGLEPLWIDGSVRWLRAPISKLLLQAEEVLGKGEVQLGGKQLLASGLSQAS